MCAVGVREAQLLEGRERRRLFYVFEERVEAGLFGWKEQKEAQPKGIA